MKQYKAIHDKQSKIFRYIIWFLIVLAIVGGCAYAYAKYKSNIPSEQIADQIESPDAQSDLVEVKDNKPQVMVHVAGSVTKPDVVVLEEGARVKDAIEAAGGLLEQADIRSINLAAEVTDGSKIYIPKLGEQDSLETNTTKQESSKADSKVNINTASKDELMKLPGVGESTAEAILEERKKGKFKSIQDLKRISGIGDKKFEKLQSHIRV